MKASKKPKRPPEPAAMSAARQSTPQSGSNMDAMQLLQAHKTTSAAGASAKDSGYMQGSTEIQISDQPVRSVDEAEKLAWSILNMRD